MNEVLTTLWGDDGAECDMLSALPAVLHFAELCWLPRGQSPHSSARTHAVAGAAAGASALGESDVSPATQNLFRVLTGGASLPLFLRAAAIDNVPGRPPCWGNITKQVGVLSV